MLPLTQSYDPRSQSDIAWALPQIAARGAMTTIVGPVGIGSLYAVALTVHAAVRGLRVGTVLSRTHPTAHGLQIGGAVEAAQLDDETRSGIKALLFSLDALATGTSLDNAEDLQRFEAMLRAAVDIAVIDNAADVFGPSNTGEAVVQRVARIVRTSDANLVAICRAGSGHEAALRDYSTIVLSLDASEPDVVRVTWEKVQGLAMPEPLTLRLSTEHIKTCTGEWAAVPALLAPPSLPSSVAPATPAHGANQPEP